MQRPPIDELMSLSNATLAENYHVNERTIQRWRSAYIQSIPKSAKPVWDDVLHIVSGSGCVIYPDLHIPFHDNELIEWAFRFQVAWGIDVAVVAGDFLDEETFSPFIPEPGNVFSDELAMGHDILSSIADVADRVYVLRGNHESRLEKLTKRELGMLSLAKLLDAPANVQASPYSYCYYNEGWIIGHPKEYSSIRGSIPQKLAGIYHSHILSGHGHHWSMSEDAGGSFLAVDMPCMADTTRLSYKMRVLSTAPAYSQGFTIIKRGTDGQDYASNYHKRWTDFSAELRKYNMS